LQDIVEKHPFGCKTNPSFFLISAVSMKLLTAKILLFYRDTELQKP
jgi:hypothetical protein